MTTPTSDILIIGGGVAGLTLALTVADTHSVALIRPAQDDKGASRWAQGGIAAVLSPDDHVDDHVNDTLIAGDGLCDEQAVRFTVEHGPEAIAWLIGSGVPFTPDHTANARYPFHLTREGGHNARRIIHADDATGRAVVDTLLQRVLAHPNISQYHHLSVVGLMQDEQGACIGAYALDEQQQWHALTAHHTVLATGGASGLYQHTTTPAPSSGEGMIMAAELGATLMNLEFQQFHPTCLYDPDGPAFLISEAVRGEGGYLLNAAGERFMPALDTRAELAPRDVVARAIDAEIQAQTLPHVWLDVRHLGDEAIHHHFPTIQAHCASRGIDITQQPIPVVPAAHYSCGGVATDLTGATGVPRLFAIGETACTGLHGANRMASNSLLECLVFARSCAQAIQRTAPDTAQYDIKLPALPAAHGIIDTQVGALRQQTRAIMSQHVAIVRSAAGLATASDLLTQIADTLAELSEQQMTAEAQRLQQLINLARLTVVAAQQRHESRGLHYTTDWPGHAENSQPSRLTLNDLSKH
ncbi:L-aspartate oxidase [Halomonas sp. HL-93]|uniref:L-aspartate oxidase n=1 Tax=Halomonas sp. HL-93 TaxID=1666906 RepID=UPI0006DABFB1|nr:L-aspartate oxidase [Halomonas sp. HL-93]KPQ29328.1 MAG: L-aspartate oxidase NadB [Halomonas sp. HL-93]SBR47744.1 L-aspartate oxidase [Halomonas sp. HL-93]